MHIYTTLNMQQLGTIAESVGVKLNDAQTMAPVSRGPRAGKNHLSTTIRPVDESTREVRNGRRIYACTWEAHRDFYRAIYAHDAEAEIDSAIARYRGADEFERLHRLTSRHLGDFIGKVTA